MGDCWEEVDWKIEMMYVVVEKGDVVEWWEVN